MPSLKQPSSLEKMALDTLHRFVLDYCNQLSVNVKPDELRQGVSVIKEHICSFIPWPLLAEFSNKFLDQFFSGHRPDSHKKAALEIFMDIEIVGLRCTGQMMKLLDPKDLRRFRILDELDVQLSVKLELDFENFILTELTTFIYPKYCTDLDLKVIGQNCSKLQVLKVPASEVTDEGLRALSICSELRVVDVFNCQVSNNGINSLLAVHKKIEELAHWDLTSYWPGTGEVSSLDSSVYPLIWRYSFRSVEEDSSFDLETIIAKFPNLTHLKIDCLLEKDLTILQDLKKLTGFEINYYWHMLNDIEDLWITLKELLRYIGSNITMLKATCNECSWFQDDVNFIFDYCPNLEYLDVPCGELKVIVLPPLQNLKEFISLLPVRFYDSGEPEGLEFGIMPSLETLSLVRHKNTVKKIEAIMLDDIKFPKLSVMKTESLQDEEIMQLEEIARNRNIDFKITERPESDLYFKLFHSLITDGSRNGIDYDAYP